MIGAHSLYCGERLRCKAGASGVGLNENPGRVDRRPRVRLRLGFNPVSKALRKSLVCKVRKLVQAAGFQVGAKSLQG